MFYVFNVVLYEIWPEKAFLDILCHFAFAFYDTHRPWKYVKHCVNAIPLIVTEKAGLSACQVQTFSTFIQPS